MSQFLSIKEVAALLGKSEKWTYQRQQEIPGRFLIGKSIFFDKEVLISTLRERATRHHKKDHALSSVDNPHGL